MSDELVVINLEFTNEEYELLIKTLIEIIEESRDAEEKNV